MKKFNLILVAFSMLISSMVSGVGNANPVIPQNEILNEETVKNALQSVVRHFANEWIERSGISEKLNLESLKNRVAGAKDENKLSGKTILLDPGHGGTNPGAVANQVQESDCNLAVSLKVKELLEKEGAKVVLSRDTDRNVAARGSSLSAELQARLDIAAANDADIFVSVHSNSNENANVKGAMSFYYDEPSKTLAQNIQEQMIKTTNAIDKGVVKESFYVLRNSNIPAVLVELGFLTNTEEAAKLNTNSYQDKLAQGIYQGILQYMQVS